MARRSFSPESVQPLIPLLEQVFGRLALLADALRIDHAELGEAKAVDQATLVDQIGEKTREIDDLLEKVEAMGGTVKDPAQGLVDFSWRREGQEVCLCWRYGEKRIAWWHTVDEGFQGRKPIEAAPRPVSSLLN